MVTGCGPKATNIPVAYFQPGDWELGEIKDCQRAQDRNLLLCDISEYDTQLDLLSALPKSEATVRADRLRSKTENAKTFAVMFQSEKPEGLWWKCLKNNNGISCR